jgi:hypothetical protein
LSKENVGACRINDEIMPQSLPEYGDGDLKSDLPHLFPLRRCKIAPH